MPATPLAAADLLAALLLGIIEGITEFLPISSTGHLLIAEHWLGHRSDLFNIAIQAGAILAVVLIYRRRLWELGGAFLGRRALATPSASVATPAGGHASEPLPAAPLPDARSARDYGWKLLVAFLVTAVLGVAVKQAGFALPERIEPIAWALVIGGIWMLAAEWLAARRARASGERARITWVVAVLVGIAQVVAGVFPGTSRSAAAIFVALLAGTTQRAAATEFAFLVGIPTMFAATGYELLDVWRSGAIAGENWPALAVAFVASAITAFIAVTWLLRYIQTHRFTVFAVYRLILGAGLLLWLSLQ